MPPIPTPVHRAYNTRTPYWTIPHKPDPSSDDLVDSGGVGARLDGVYDSAFVADFHNFLSPLDAVCCSCTVVVALLATSLVFTISKITFVYIYVKGERGTWPR